MNLQKNMMTLSLLILASTLAGCINDNDDNNGIYGAKHAAIINTIAADWTGSDIELVDIGNNVFSGDLTANAAGYDNGLSDYSVTSYGKNYYRIGRFGIDTITKYSITDPNTPVYTYSTLDNADADSSNPQQLIFASESKAYLLRYNSTTAWIVNPSATTENEFKIGEIDLSGYDDGDGLPEMSDGVIVDGKLYITLQRQESWTVIDGNAYVAVIDTVTDQEIDTTPDVSDDLPGIHLQTSNPIAIVYHADAGLFVQSVGDYGYYGSPQYIGGIEKISLADYSTDVIVNDGNDSTHPYGLISNLVIVSETQGYFVGYHGWGSSSLYQFNPATGFVNDGVIAEQDNVDIRHITLGPENSLWVSIADPAAPHVLVIATASNYLKDTIATTYDPTGIVFATIQ